MSDPSPRPTTDRIDTATGQQFGGLWLFLATLGIQAGSIRVLMASRAKSQD